MADESEIDHFLRAFPQGINALAAELRELVVRAEPGAIERLRHGWQLIGYDIPVAKGTRYFAYVAPEQEHIHLGFEHGALMADPERVLQGAHLRLRKIRFLTYRPGDRIPARTVVDLVRHAASIAALPRADRSALMLARHADEQASTES